MPKKLALGVVAAGAILTLAACGGPRQGLAEHQPVLQGPPVTTNNTVYEPAIVCTMNQIRTNSSNPVRIAVGNIPDETGKWSEEQGGAVVTQGGSNMAMSALGKMDPLVIQVERYNTTIGEMEKKWADIGLIKELENKLREVLAGEILGSDYYIVGSITEANFNIQSFGGEVSFAGVGVGARQYTMNVAVDLRLVHTRSLEVVSTVSKQKQYSGYETKAGIFSFFGGGQLFDLSLGSKNQEPLQLGIRSTIELGVLELVSSIYDVNPTSCVKAVENDFVHHAPVEASYDSKGRDRRER